MRSLLAAILVAAQLFTGVRVRVLYLEMRTLHRHNPDHGRDMHNERVGPILKFFWKPALEQRSETLL
jgi:hypothetical protein